LGMAAGLGLRNQPRTVRFTGAVIAVCGLSLLA
jgi:hypothetical protein